MRVVSLAHDMPTGPPLHPYQILSNLLSQTVWEFLPVQDFDFREDNYITKRERELSFLHATHLLVLFFIFTIYYQNMSKGIEVMERTRMHFRFLLQGR